MLFRSGESSGGRGEPCDSSAGSKAPGVVVGVMVNTVPPLTACHFLFVTVLSTRVTQPPSLQYCTCLLYLPAWRSACWGNKHTHIQSHTDNLATTMSHTHVLCTVQQNPNHTHSHTLLLGPEFESAVLAILRCYSCSGC